jgi:UDP-N-acetylmuramate--alanine ligase
MHFTVQRGGSSIVQPVLEVVLNLTGRHNVLNALAAVAIAQELQVGDADLLRALAAFGGVGRRFEHYGDLPLAGGGVVTVIDDYGHHPVEIAATLAAARGAYPGRRLVLAFQPHRYSRTRDCFAEFISVLGQANALLLGSIYAAGEAPIEGITGRALADAVRAAGSAPCTYVEQVEDFASCIAEQAQAGDVVLCMGAGTISEVAGQLARSLQKTERLTQEGQRQ